MSKQGYRVRLSGATALVSRGRLRAMDCFYQAKSLNTNGPYFNSSQMMLGCTGARACCPAPLYHLSPSSVSSRSYSPALSTSVNIPWHTATAPKPAYHGSSAAEHHSLSGKEATATSMEALVFGAEGENRREPDSPNSEDRSEGMNLPVVMSGLSRGKWCFVFGQHGNVW